jgi:uncharacterized membrane protein YtjA (UPF0391 family)
MLSYAITFLIIAIIAAICGFSGIAGTAAWIAQILFVIFLILFVVSLITGRRPPRLIEVRDLRDGAVKVSWRKCRAVDANLRRD